MRTLISIIGGLALLIAAPYVMLAQSQPQDSTPQPTEVALETEYITFDSAIEGRTAFYASNYTIKQLDAIGTDVLVRYSKNGRLVEAPLDEYPARIEKFKGAQLLVPEDLAKIVATIAYDGQYLFSSEEYARVATESEPDGEEDAAEPQILGLSMLHAERYITDELLVAKVTGVPPVEDAVWIVNGELTSAKIITGQSTLRMEVEPGTSYNVGFVVLDKNGDPLSVIPLGGWYAETSVPDRFQAINQHFLPWRLTEEVNTFACGLKTLNANQQEQDCLAELVGTEAIKAYQRLLSGNYDGDALSDHLDVLPADGRVYTYNLWGASSHLDWVGGDPRAKQIELLRELGANATRFNVDGQGGLQPSSYRLLKASGIMPIALWGSGSHTPAAIARTFGQRAQYGIRDSVAFYEALNEPNLDMFWGMRDDSQQFSAELLYEILRAMYSALTQADPSAVFVVGAPSPGRDTSLYWTDYYLQLAAIDATQKDPLFDKHNVVIAFHNYTDPRPEWGGMDQMVGEIGWIANQFPEAMLLGTESMFPRWYNVTSQLRAQAITQFNGHLIEHPRVMGNMVHTLAVPGKKLSYLSYSGGGDEFGYVLVFQDGKEWKRTQEFFALQDFLIDHEFNPLTVE